MKVIPIALQAHYDSGTTTLARLWKITRTDGEVFGFTDHDRKLTFGGLDYVPTSVFDASAISTKAELNVDNMEVTGVLDNDGITEEDMEAGRWDGAAIEVRQVNWADLTNGAEILRVGETGNVQRKAGQYTAELRGLMQKLQNNIGYVVTPSCNAKLGDTRCGVDLGALEESGTVADVVSEHEFEAALAGAVDFYAMGEVEWVTGANAGIVCDVKTNDGIGGITLQLKTPFPMQIGDTFTIRPGCDKSLAACKNTYDNVVNFRGFWAVPGRDKTFLVGGQ